MSRKSPHHNPKPVTYRTPGRDCPHADKGCCPKCFDPMTRNVRYDSRNPMPTTR